MKLYIIGPMRGLPEFGYPKFRETAAALRKLGHEVVDPSEEFGGKTNLPIEAYVRQDLVTITIGGVRGVVLLPDYELSEIGFIEYMTAKALSLPFFRLIQDDMFGYLQPVTELHPCEVAANTVREVMKTGRTKHAAGTWRTESLQNHLLKAARHAVSAQLIAARLSPDDKEDHASNAVARSVMALVVQKESSEK